MAENPDSHDHVLPKSTRNFCATSFLTGNRLVSPLSDEIVSPPSDTLVSPLSDQIVSPSSLLRRISIKLILRNISYFCNIYE